MAAQLGRGKGIIMIRQPSSRTGENPPYGVIGGIEETSASFEARSAPQFCPTNGENAEDSVAGFSESLYERQFWRWRRKRVQKRCHFMYKVVHLPDIRTHPASGGSLPVNSPGLAVAAELDLRPLMLEEGGACRAEQRCELGPGEAANRPATVFTRHRRSEAIMLPAITA